MTHYLDTLNPEQRKAVEATEGPVLIVAGAGSGKTRVLTYRIAHMIRKGVDPFQIMSLTFTNKAAKEMRERIEKVVGKEARNIWMGTFHSIFARILRAEAHHLGYPQNFTIYDTDDSKSLIKSILAEMKLDDKLYKVSQVLGRISNAKNNLITPQAYLGDTDLMTADRLANRPHLGTIYAVYCNRCFKAGAMDFDDLLLQTNILLRDHPDVLNKYQHKFKYLLVDEFQDTNYSQYLIIKKLSAVHENICVVGDDAQSIYAFRGATIENILNFEKDFPDLQVFKLEQNYRSTKNIVNAAGHIISHNRNQLKKTVWTDNEEGEKIKLFRAMTDNEEGKMVSDIIFEEKMNHQRKNSEFAILYRTNAQSRAFEEALRKKNIPYRIYGGMSFYQRKEIKDLMAYFRLAVNPHDEEALKRVINYPVRGIGKTTLDRLMVAAAEHNISLWDVLLNLEKLNISSRSLGPVADFREMIKAFHLNLYKQNAHDQAMEIAKRSGVLNDLYNDKTIEGIARYENMVELLNGIKDFTDTPFVDENGEVITRYLDTYIQEVALLTDADKDDPEDNDKVTLMTIHASKGLEFPCVFVVGLEENLFPSQLSMNSREELEEERRLFYVAATRAEQKLFLSFATSRFRFGNIVNSEPSRFIDELDQNLLELHTGFMTNAEPSPRGGGNWLGGEKITARLGSGPGYTQRYSQEKEYNPTSKKIVNAAPAPAPPVVSDPNFQPDDTSALEAGQMVLHQRFGKGKVTAIEGHGENRKASIEFEQLGVKQIVLRFAKLKILG